MSDVTITELATEVYHGLRNVGAVIEDAAIDASELFDIINRALDDVLVVIGDGAWTERL